VISIYIYVYVYVYTYAYMYIYVYVLLYRALVMKRVAKNKSISDTVNEIKLLEKTDIADKNAEMTALVTGKSPWWSKQGKKSNVFDTVHRKQFPHPVVEVCLSAYNMYIQYIYVRGVIDKSTL
jgi:nitroimidazol reductase NimA-like FMN-containing flavoprotein (pyridoxamine 5'-phosphate oxidase superfamily)